MSATRDRIMDVALALFARQGVAATTVTVIEAQAGLSAGSGGFYRHFADKEAVLAAVVDRELSRVKKSPSAQPAAQGGKSPRAALAVQLRADVDFLAEMAPLMAIMTWERHSAPDIIERVRSTMQERGIELGVADLLLADPPPTVVADPAAAATVMQSAMIGYCLSLDFYGRAPGDVDADRFTSTLAALLAGEGSAR